MGHGKPRPTPGGARPLWGVRGAPLGRRGGNGGGRSRLGRNRDGGGQERLGRHRKGGVGGTTVAAVAAGHKVAVISPASFNGEAGCSAVALALRAPVGGKTTVAVLDSGHEAAVFSLALLFDEAGRVAVALVLHAPPVPTLGDVSGSVPEPPNPSLGEACGGCGSGTSPDGGAKGVRRPGEPRLAGQVGLAEKGDAIRPGLRA